MLNTRYILVAFIVSLLLFGSIEASSVSAQSMGPVITVSQYVKGTDHFLGTSNVLDIILESGYQSIKTEGYAFTSQMPGTVPLKLYANADRTDYFSTATVQGEQEAIGSHYTFVRTLGYVYSSPQPGTVPLQLYYRRPSWPSSQDNFTTTATTTPLMYRNIRTEGYIFTDYPLTMLVLYSSPSGDYRTDIDRPQPIGYTASTSGVWWDACVLKYPVQGTESLDLYYSSDREDSFTTATAQGRHDAIGSGYTGPTTVGYVYPSSLPNTVALSSAWSQTRLKNVTSTPLNILLLAASGNYVTTRVEGYAFVASACNPMN